MYFFVKGKDSLIPVEIKAKDEFTPSLNNLITKDKYQNVKGNTIYVAKEKLELGEGFDKNLKGYGMFKYSNELDLTDAHKKNRTNWKIEKFRNLKTSCKGRDGKAEFDENGAYNAPCRCQEIVVDIGDSSGTNRYSEFEIKKWIYDLINNNCIK